MKILHAADLHLDSPFDALSEAQAAHRRREQRELLDKLCGLCDSESVSLVLLAGDLLDSDASYFETHDALLRAFREIRAEIFIAPGNHDYYCARSPYAFLEFPENVHIFKSPAIERAHLPTLGCTVWGAGFTESRSRPLLGGFAVPEPDMLNIMVLHGDTGGDEYNHISQSDIADSGLDYLALGHIHTFSGIKRAGKTHYAYPGCPEGRGFDETGVKGVLLGEVTMGSADLSFVPLGGREYRIVPVDLTGLPGVLDAVMAALPDDFSRDVCRVVLTGEHDGKIDLARLSEQLLGRVFSLSLRDKTKPLRDIWADAQEDSLRGVFLREMQSRLGDAGNEQERETVLLAVRFGLAALEGAEELRS